MKQVVVAAALGLMASFAAPSVQAGPIERACLDSGRAGASAALCSCIQRVANQTLAMSEQRQGSRFFRDPARAQDVRQSARGNDRALWQRWRAFGEAAEVNCASYASR